MPLTVLPAYGLTEHALQVEAFGTGLINHTWKVTSGSKSYILQRVNQDVFKKPADIAQNMRLLGEYLLQQHPDYNFVGPVSSTTGDGLVYQQGKGYFRLFPFVPGSQSTDVAKSASQAYEAARQFGKFTHLLSGFDVTQLKITIPAFHDLTLRYQQFLLALENGSKQRVQESGELIRKIIAHSDIVTTFGYIKQNPQFKLRVTHHDTKISNVLFDQDGKGICVIDLDTVMPGYFISDIGDMMRTYLCPVSEEEKETSRISVREDFYHSIVDGYLSEMQEVLTPSEKKFIFYSGKFMIYMQAIRFLTDHLNSDVYYGAKYPGHNFNRANNQLTLLEKLIEKEPVLNRSLE